METDKAYFEDNRMSVSSAKDSPLDTSFKLSKTEAQMQVKKDGLKRLLNQVEGLAVYIYLNFEI
jgi:hypothetical protein